MSVWRRRQFRSRTWLVFAPVDFEKQNLDDGLAAAALDAELPTFFTWLGVVPYLEAEAVWSTLRFIARLPAGAHVAFDYADPPGTLSPEARAVFEERAARVTELGEPWVTFFEPAELHAGLLAAGFTRIDDLGPREIAARFFPSRAGDAPERGGHILLASTVK